VLCSEKQGVGDGRTQENADAENGAKVDTEIKPEALVAASHKGE
jgi:hypothetical protein